MVFVKRHDHKDLEKMLSLSVFLLLLSKVTQNHSLLQKADLNTSKNGIRKEIDGIFESNKHNFICYRSDSNKL
jgi:hypothetical protein